MTLENLEGYLLQMMMTIEICLHCNKVFQYDDETLDKYWVVNWRISAFVVLSGCILFAHIIWDGQSYVSYVQILIVKFMVAILPSLYNTNEPDAATAQSQNGGHVLTTPIHDSG